MGIVAIPRRIYDASPRLEPSGSQVEDFAAKTVDALELGVHVLLIDLLPPSRHDPSGLHATVWDQFADAPYDLPVAEPLTLASYAAGPPVTAYVEHAAIGGSLPEMPLFLHSERYILVPLEATYQSAYRGVPAFWRDVLEGRA
jgi:hypothetical protein